MGDKKEFNKIHNITILKDVLSIIVMLCHYAMAFFPGVLTGNIENVHSQFEIKIFKSPFYAFVKGPFCVYIFWTISGFLLYYSYQRKPSEKIWLVC